MNSDFLIQQLNKEQLAAVTHTKGPAIILAGAGSGKTRVLTYKAAFLLSENKCLAENILMLTFTNKAAKEMKARISQTIDLKFKPQQIFGSTFHSFAAYLLRKHGLVNNVERNFAIFDEADQKDLIKMLLKDYSNPLKIKPGVLGYFISQAKNNLDTPTSLAKKATDLFSEEIAKLYSLYQKQMDSVNALDFDDLLFEAVNLLKVKPTLASEYQNRFQYLLIDEYQDTNHAQYLLAKLLVNPQQQITIVGDFSQSIYSWRGADFTNLQKFQKDFPKAKIFNLEENYRSRQPILDLAYKVISQNTNHPILKLWTNKTGGEEVEIIPLPTAFDEALFVINKIKQLNFDGEYGLNEMAILYRTNSQSRLFEEVCLKNNVPYKIHGGTRFYERKEIKDLLACLRFLLNPKDKVSEKRITGLGKKRSAQIIKVLSKLDILNKPVEILKTLLDQSVYLDFYDQKDPEDASRLENIQELLSVAESYTHLTEFLDSVTLIEEEYEQVGINTEKINLMTLHAAKGLEYSVVFIVGLEEGILPHTRALNSNFELEEERRLFYVGITRAKEKLFLTYALKRYVYGHTQYSLPSQFLTETELVDEAALY